ncbi:hypothetical protein GCM10008927_00910 [Amylibacter ulvae]|uniref:DUF302 domain-containing protein n=1 Tax=Paramylibacter ulvae TaxID=1651968 RepID=A0ABQ3CV85_9RHOB|nr:DUF302 domain-containing protein [Amylibacter ulvae]GHA40536.1 hypothetical protein GCM10008927_00910 [Amylibacter ulvae]
MADTMITKNSPHSVSETIDRMAAAVEGAGAKVFARVDHAAGAKSVDMDLRPTEMLLFGNPKLGTPAMNASQTIGLDLPLRVLAYQVEDGSVKITYRAPMDMAQAHDADADLEVFKMMTGALDNLTNKAIAE